MKSTFFTIAVAMTTAVTAFAQSNTTLAFFKATQQPDLTVQINWATTSEQNSALFTVQKSIDGGAHWTDLRTLTAATNSQKKQNYISFDLRPEAKTMNYRLKMQNTSGEQTFGSTIAAAVIPKVNSNISFDATSNAILIEPNKNTNQLVTLRVYANVGGAELFKKEVRCDKDEVQVALPKMAAGVYLVTLESMLNFQADKMSLGTEPPSIMVGN